MQSRFLTNACLAMLLALLPACDHCEPCCTPPLERIEVAPDSRGFVLAISRRPFHPWGHNYGNTGRLIEDFWETDWATVERDFRAMKSMGANVVRVHLQFGKFMRDPQTPNDAELERLSKLVKLVEEVHIYLDLTGLACYRPSDVPKWYDALPEADRWAAQARFWSAIAECFSDSPALFCYDLINEPLAAGQRSDPPKWYSGKLLGGLDFLQFINSDPAGRTRDEIVRQWIAKMSAAIRSRDAKHLITVGMLPPLPNRGFFSGFDPKKVAPQVDFISAHIYPEKGKVPDALAILRSFAVGKPVVIEETFPLSCSAEELEQFLRASREHACGWIGHYNGESVEQLEALQNAKTISVAQGIWLSWLRLFRKLGTEFSP
ncbi:MAG TPA: cellulase family glycosylhydrolase [Planctomycetota bacterium]|nr:cellulase family glycosylhydrolase [Planctomycetota bacterium]